MSTATPSGSPIVTSTTPQAIEAALAEIQGTETPALETKPNSDNNNVSTQTSENSETKIEDTGDKLETPKETFSQLMKEKKESKRIADALRREVESLKLKLSEREPEKAPEYDKTSALDVLKAHGLSLDDAEKEALHGLDPNTKKTRELTEKLKKLEEAEARKAKELEEESKSKKISETIASAKKTLKEKLDAESSDDLELTKRLGERGVEMIWQKMTELNDANGELPSFKEAALKVESEIEAELSPFKETNKFKKWFQATAPAAQAAPKTESTSPTDSGFKKTLSNTPVETPKQETPSRKLSREEELAQAINEIENEKL